MYRKKDPPDFLPARKDMKVVATLVDDVSGTKVHIGLVDSCYEILLEPPHPGERHASPTYPGSTPKSSGSSRISHYPSEPIGRRNRGRQKS